LKICTSNIKKKIKSLEDKLDIERAQNLKLQNEILHERSQGKLLSSSLLQSNEFLKIQVTTLQQKIEDSSKNVSRKSDPLFYDKMLPSNEEKSPKRDYDNYSSSSKYDSYDRDEKRKRSLTPEKKKELLLQDILTKNKEDHQILIKEVLIIERITKMIINQVPIHLTKTITRRIPTKETTDLQNNKTRRSG